MEPKTIIIILCVALFVASITIIVQLIWHNDKTGFLFNVMHKLNKENSRLNVELDITADQCNKQSKRIAELIELCDKLQPDLVGRQEIKVDIDCDINFVFKTREQLNAWYLDKGLESAAKVDICKWTHNFTLTPNGIENSRFEAVDKSKIKIE